MNDKGGNRKAEEQLDSELTNSDSFKARIKSLLLQNVAVTGLLILVIASTALSPHFLTVDNIFNVWHSPKSLDSFHSAV
jgi:hypothetical protein